MEAIVDEEDKGRLDLPARAVVAVAAGSRSVDALLTTPQPASIIPVFCRYEGGEAMGILTNCRRACVIALLALTAVVGGYAQAFSLGPGTLGFSAGQAGSLPSCGLELDRSAPPDFSAILNLQEETNGGVEAPRDSGGNRSRERLDLSGLHGLAV
jgi:hypothetical protein